MKFRSITVLSLLMTTVFFYASCKKDTKSPASSDSTKIGVQIAMNFYKSFSGSFGGDVNNGVPTSHSVKKSIKINDLGCGSYTETPVSYTTNQGDTIKGTLSGVFKVIINCNNTNTSVVGYTLADSTTNIGFNPSVSYNNLVQEFYTVVSLAPNYAKMGLNGSQTSVIKSQSRTNAAESSVQNNAYTLTGFVIDSTTSPFDITAGTAAFTSVGTSDGTSFSYTGTIVFLPHHKAKVSFDDKVVLVNLLTGETTLQD